MLIGVDLGGAKIEAAALDEDGRFLARGRVPTPCDDYEAAIACIVGMVASIESASDAPAA